MSAKLDAVGHYMDAVATPDEGFIGRLETVLADDVSSRGPFGSATARRPWSKG